MRLSQYWNHLWGSWAVVLYLQTLQHSLIIPYYEVCITYNTVEIKYLCRNERLNGLKTYFLQHSIDAKYNDWELRSKKAFVMEGNSKRVQENIPRRPDWGLAELIISMVTGNRQRMLVCIAEQFLRERKEQTLARVLVKLSHIYMWNPLNVVDSFTVLFTFCDFNSSIILKSNKSKEVSQV